MLVNDASGATPGSGLCLSSAEWPAQKSGIANVVEGVDALPTRAVFIARAQALRSCTLPQLLKLCFFEVLFNVFLFVALSRL